MDFTYYGTRNGLNYSGTDTGTFDAGSIVGASSADSSTNYGYTGSSATAGDYGSIGIGAIKAGTGLANAYMSFKNYELAQDQFEFNKDLTNRNILNQGTTINANIDNQKDVGLAMGTKALTDSDRAAFTASMDNRKVNTAAI